MPHIERRDVLGGSSRVHEGPHDRVFAPDATEFVADQVEPAKAAALDKLDEGQRALGIATGRLRTKVAVGEPVAEKEL